MTNGITALRDRLQDAFSDILAADLRAVGSSRCYLVLVSETELLPAGDFAGLHGPHMHEWLQPWISDWQGPGPTALFDDGYFTGQPDSFDVVAEFTGITCHEMAHAVDAGLFAFTAGGETQPETAVFRRLIQQPETQRTTATRSPRDGHGPSFLRAAIHLRHRLERRGIECPFPCVVWSEFYGIHPLAAYWRALGGECERLESLPMMAIRQLPIPAEFMELWDQDTRDDTRPYANVVDGEQVDALSKGCTNMTTATKQISAEQILTGLHWRSGRTVDDELERLQVATYLDWCLLVDRYSRGEITDNREIATQLMRFKSSESFLGFTVDESELRRAAARRTSKQTEIDLVSRLRSSGSHLGQMEAEIRSIQQEIEEFVRPREERIQSLSWQITGKRSEAEQVITAPNRMRDLCKSPLLVAIERKYRAASHQLELEASRLFRAIDRKREMLKSNKQVLKRNQLEGFKPSKDETDALDQLTIDIAAMEREHAALINQRDEIESHVTKIDQVMKHAIAV